MRPVLIFIISLFLLQSSYGQEIESNKTLKGIWGVSIIQPCFYQKEVFRGLSIRAELGLKNNLYPSSRARPGFDVFGSFNLINSTGVYIRYNPVFGAEQISRSYDGLFFQSGVGMVTDLQTIVLNDRPVAMKTTLFDFGLGYRTGLIKNFYFEARGGLEKGLDRFSISKRPFPYLNLDVGLQL